MLAGLSFSRIITPGDKFNQLSYLMGLSAVQTTIVVGWALRAVAALVFLICHYVQGPRAKTLPLLLGFFLFLASFVGSAAEYHDYALPYARLSEVSVASLFVALIYSAMFKLETPAAMTGTVFLIGSNVLYALAARATESSLEAGLLVLGGFAAVVALMHLTFAHSRQYSIEWLLAVAGGVFYLVVALQTVFGPYVLDEWNRLTWTIIWEVAITLFYVSLVTISWMSYQPGTTEGGIPSDFAGAIAYVFETGNWAPSAPKFAD